MVFQERGVSEPLSEKLWRYYYKHLSKAVEVGYSPNIEQTNPDLVSSLKHNIATFSAFKETSFKQQIEQALTKDGRVLPWNEFKKEAEKLDTLYNKRWLQTEYNQTVANALSAQKYEEYIANKRIYPNLTYHAVHDERTRETHRAWDGLRLPVEHAFWQTHLPPNDWGCRCYVEPTAGPVTEGVRTEEVPIKEAFANNPALSGEIFPIIPYAKGMSEKVVKEVEKQVEKRLEKLGENYIEKVIKEYPNGGKIIISNLVNTEGSDYERVYNCCDFFAKQGKETTILPRFNSPLRNELYQQLYADLQGTPYWGKCPDFKVGNKFYEHEGFLGDANTLSFKEAFKKATHMLGKGIKQSDKVIIDYTPCDYNSVIRTIEERIKSGQMISEVWVLRNGSLERIF
jgi:phage protein F-like protein|nr:MAG TPA: minor capsid component [Caudoviricetes sp.]